MKKKIFSRYEVLLLVNAVGWVPTRKQGGDGERDSDKHSR